MDLGALFLVLAVVLLVALFVSRPFFEKSTPAAGAASGSVSPEEHQISALLAERDRILTALQELDFDNALEKIPPEDYPIQRSYLLAQGASVLRQLDEYLPQPAAQSAEDRLEAVVAARRADGVTAGSRAGRSTPLPEDELEELIASRRQARAESSAGFCPKCGKAVQKSDRFCPKCGTTLSKVE